MEAEKAVSRARVQLLLRQPWFGHLAMGLVPREMPEHMPIRTMATDGRSMWYDPAFVEGLQPDELMGIVCHEVLHPALLHITRRGHREPLKWNIATDYAVNSLLLENKLALPPGVLYDPRFRDMAAEHIYDLIPDPPTGSGGGQGGTLDDHSPWETVGKGQGDDEEGDGESGGQHQGNGKELEQEWRERVAEATTMARQQGKLPAGMESLIEDLLHPKLDWKTILRDMITSSIKSNHRLVPPLKKHLWRKIYLPSMTGESIEVAVGIDTSGSISEDLLREFLSEVKGICEQYADYTLYLFSCDAAVHQEWDITPYEDMPKQWIGRGGTDFRPVFDRVRERGLVVSCLVYFTDLLGTFPERAPEYPVIWTTPTRDYQVPFGDLVIIEE